MCCCMYHAIINERGVNPTIMPAMNKYKQTACEAERPQGPQGASSLHCHRPTLPAGGDETTCSQQEFYGEVSMRDSNMRPDPIIMNVG